MKTLLFSGSLRTESLNRKLVAVAKGLLEKNGSEVTVADLRELQIPVYDGDIEAKGIPEGVQKLGNLIRGADSLVISSPEYNASIAGSLKNTIDWVSRLRPVPLEGKPVFLMGASPGGFGSIRALGATRAPFDTLSAFVYPQTFALPKAHEAFTPEGGLKDAGTEKRLKETLEKFTAFAAKFPTR